jgi:hypothetical protein
MFNCIVYDYVILKFRITEIMKPGKMVLVEKICSKQPYNRKYLPFWVIYGFIIENIFHHIHLKII